MDFKQIVEKRRKEMEDRIIALKLWLNENPKQPWEVRAAVQDRIMELEEYLPNLEENIRGAMEHS